MRSIEIDLEVHRAIENGRSGFDESENAILRRLIGIDLPPAPRPVRPSIRSARSSGAYSIVFGDQPIEGNSLKELLRRVLLLMEKRRPGFLERLADQRTPRGRHIVSRSPEGLYPKTPHLARLGERLNRDWWFDTNISRKQVEAYLKLLARMAHLATVPVLHKRPEKSALSPADLGLDG